MTDQTSEKNDSKGEGVQQHPLNTSLSDAQEQMNISNTIEAFDTLLGEQFERLMDTRYGNGELPLNIFNVSCMVLLATRETEIEAFPVKPPPRYTEQSLLKELIDTSIDPGGTFSSYISGMEKKEYIEITDDGRFLSTKSTISMARLFDRIFPNMPGLNLIAYIGQMIDEVLAERKGINEASSQFRQLLDMQGVPMNPSGNGRQKTPKKKYSYLRLGDAPPETVKKPRKITVIETKPVDIFSALEIKTVVSPVSSRKDNATETQHQGIENQYQFNTTLESGIDEIETEQIEDVSYAAMDLKDKDESFQITDSHNTDIEPEEPINISNADNIQDEFEPPDDMDIEAKIAHFEEKLGLTCPLCRSAEIKASETARGKPYYQCANVECGFISWGKPFYIECPKCENHFLIEAQDSTGKTRLKCPKATCSHWQNFPWDEPDKNFDTDEADIQEAAPRKKVRRVRRVVRRKKR